MTFSLRLLTRLLLNSEKLPNAAFTVHQRHYVRKVRPKSNPGIAERLSLLEDQANLDLDDPSLDFDEHESDFQNLAPTYNEFKKDMAKYRQKERNWIVRRKYFEQQLPNFLTWSEKEQIRHLHKTDPVEYPVERLAEIFPASCEVVQKIVKASWKIQDPKRILNHDKNVEANWKMLKKGELDVDAEYKEHLLKFSSRDKIILDETKYLPQQSMTFDKPQFTTQSTEFSSIIQSYENSKTKTKEQLKLPSTKDDIINFPQLDKPLQETYVMNTGTPTSKKPQSFSEFKKELNLPDQQNFPPPAKKIFAQDIPVPIFGKNYQERSFETDKKVVPMPEKIQIPKKFWQRGQTYKVNDCFYDDDGRFLYRVPGLE
ncbi:uncharacterized protein LOC113366472 [Ctenocephalides felis]|uniref:uncharacterized protein LOC113366472 n=1 Tax=Ctenocephalides felis TaxID=7515 RepID=UPI000E6E3225|nr:uncharacterized protein LOC113366472 [Ctenocephalides felis]XP_026463864.1 uncharacterized protein LOC113366472 [Ctenocephalides felis]